MQSKSSTYSTSIDNPLQAFQHKVLGDHLMELKRLQDKNRPKESPEQRWERLFEQYHQQCLRVWGTSQELEAIKPLQTLLEDHRPDRDLFVKHADQLARQYKHPDTGKPMWKLERAGALARMRSMCRLHYLLGGHLLPVDSDSNDTCEWLDFAYFDTFLPERRYPEHSRLTLRQHELQHMTDTFEYRCKAGWRLGNKWIIPDADVLLEHGRAAVR